jgi:hypothetical protein
MQMQRSVEGLRRHVQGEKITSLALLSDHSTSLASGISFARAPQILSFYATSTQETDGIAKSGQAF